MGRVGGGSMAEASACTGGDREKEGRAVALGRGGRHGQEGWRGCLTLRVSHTAIGQDDSGHVPGPGATLFSLSEDESNRFSPISHFLLKVTCFSS